MFSYFYIVVCGVVRRLSRYKATEQVNGESQNLTPRHAQTPQAIVIQIGTCDYVVDPYT